MSQNFHLKSRKTVWTGAQRVWKCLQHPGHNAAVQAWQIYLVLFWHFTSAATGIFYVHQQWLVMSGTVTDLPWYIRSHFFGDRRSWGMAWHTSRIREDPCPCHAFGGKASKHSHRWHPKSWKKYHLRFLRRLAYVVTQNHTSHADNVNLDGTWIKDLDDFSPFWFTFSLHLVDTLLYMWRQHGWPAYPVTESQWYSLHWSPLKRPLSLPELVFLHLSV